ncbi:MAG: C1 family peptidase [Planctomycetota bacterium]|jgi:C1A family cysteine protease|nr:C1 family peptidase [Planctomycetota bacterium]
MTNRTRLIAALFSALFFILITAAPAGQRRLEPRKPAPRRNSRGLGLRESTPEEMAAFRRNSRRVGRAAPNDLAVKRIMAARNVRSSRSREVAPRAAARGAELSGTAPAMRDDDLDLLGSVMNDRENTFPPVGNQGSIGACVHWAATYYMLTNNTALARGWDAKSDSKLRFSPRWTYNANNMGVDAGDTIPNSLKYLRGFGSAMQHEFDYLDPDHPDGDNPREYQELSGDPELWKNALRFRPTDHSYYVDNLETPGGLANLKSVLANGYVLAFPTYIFGWKYGVIENGPYEGQNCAVYMIKDEKSRHAMTIVGYDDGVWVDANENGREDSGETGALRIANSWGPEWEDGEDGFAWVLYDALRAESQIPGFASGGREPLIRGGIAYFLMAREDYEPLLLGEVILSSNRRCDVQMWAGMGKGPQLEVEDENKWLPNLFDEETNVSLTGIPGRPGLTTYLDFTDLVTDSGAKIWAIAVEDRFPGNEIAVEKFRLLQLSGGDWEASDWHPDCPIRFDDEKWLIWFNHAFGDEMRRLVRGAASRAADRR